MPFAAIASALGASAANTGLNLFTRSSDRSQNKRLLAQNTQAQIGFLEARKAVYPGATLQELLGSSAGSVPSASFGGASLGNGQALAAGLQAAQQKYAIDAQVEAQIAVAQMNNDATIKAAGISAEAPLEQADIAADRLEWDKFAGHIRLDIEQGVFNREQVTKGPGFLRWATLAPLGVEQRLINLFDPDDPNGSSVMNALDNLNEQSPKFEAFVSDFMAKAVEVNNSASSSIRDLTAETVDLIHTFFANEPSIRDPLLDWATSP